MAKFLAITLEDSNTLRVASGRVAAVLPHPSDSGKAHVYLDASTFHALQVAGASVSTIVAMNGLRDLVGLPLADSGAEYYPYTSGTGYFDKKLVAAIRHVPGNASHADLILTGNMGEFRIGDTPANVAAALA